LRSWSSRVFWQRKLAGLVHLRQGGPAILAVNPVMLGNREEDPIRR